jgi:integrase
MSIRQKGSTWVVEIYDPATKHKRHVKAKDHGLPVPRTERQAKALERAALHARDARRLSSTEETCDSFTARWTTDYPRGDSTNTHNHERVTKLGQDFAGRPLRSITKAEARPWARQHPGRIAAARAMYNDAIREGLADTNPFARLGMSQGDGRKDIVVLTCQEIDRLAELAIQVHGQQFGVEFAAMILWGAYTCMRPGETFAARFSRLHGDTYHVECQLNSRLGRETKPKHNSTGAIYVPDHAREAILSKPRRLHDDLMFHTKRAKQFRQTSLHEAWKTVRSAFTATLPATHHLRERLAADPEDQLDFYELRHFGASHMLNDLQLEPWIIAQQLRHSDGGTLVTQLYGHPDRIKAIQRIRRAFRGNIHQLHPQTGESQGNTATKSA